MSTTCQWCVIFGAFTMCLPMGVPWFYGNISPYMVSYFRYQVGPEAFDVHMDWLLSAFGVTMICGIVSIDWLVSKIRLQWMLMTSSLVFDLFIFLTYFSVQRSVGWTLATFMSVCGFACGNCVMLALKCASKAMPRNVSVGSAIVSSGFGLGAVLINFIVAAHVNPGNLPPDVRLRDIAYFSQTRVLDQVPGCFVVLGFTSLALHLVGFSFVSVALRFVEANDNPVDSSNVNEKLTAIRNSSTSSSRAPKASKRNHQNSNENTTAVDQLESCTESQSHIANHLTQEDTHESFDPTEENLESLNQNQNDVTLKADSKDDNNIGHHSNNPILALKPSEVLRSSTFYQLWISLGVLSYGRLVTQNFYKLFGLLWIKDDTFLTVLGSVATISTTVFRVAMGVSMDKLGVKNTIVLTLFLNAILCLFWYFAPRVDRWLYFFCMQAVNGVQGSVFIIFPMSALKLYGGTYYATNYGLLMTATLVFSLPSPLLFPVFMEYFGWFGLIAAGGVSSVLALLLIVIMMPNV